MPSVAQPRYSMFCFMLSAFPGPGLGSDGLGWAQRRGDIVPSAQCARCAHVPSVPGVQWPVSTPGQHCTLLCRVQAVTLYEWLTRVQRGQGRSLWVTCLSGGGFGCSYLQNNTGRCHYLLIEMTSIYILSSMQILIDTAYTELFVGCRSLTIIAFDIYLQ